MTVTEGDRVWYTYLLECSDGSLYTGICTDLGRRFAEHCRGEGAKYTRAFPPRRMRAAWSLPDRSTASRLEYALKKMRPEQKWDMARGGPPPLQGLPVMGRVAGDQLPPGGG